MAASPNQNSTATNAAGTTLHHITNAATILKCNKNHPLFTQKSEDNFKELT